MVVRWQVAIDDDGANLLEEGGARCRVTPVLRGNPELVQTYEHPPVVFQRSELGQHSFEQLCGSNDIAAAHRDVAVMHPSVRQRSGIAAASSERERRIREWLNCGEVASNTCQKRRLLQYPHPHGLIRALIRPEHPRMEDASCSQPVSEEPEPIQLGKHRQGSLRIMFKCPLDTGEQVGLLVY